MTPVVASRSAFIALTLRGIRNLTRVAGGPRTRVVPPSFVNEKKKKKKKKKKKSNAWVEIAKHGGRAGRMGRQEK